MENQTPRLSIHEVVKAALHTENVELIDVPVEGDAVTLLRVKTMPEFAFVMWVNIPTSTFSQMRFCVPDTDRGRSIQYPVVCACCGSETYGLKGPDADVHPDARDIWKKEMTAKFKVAIESTCKANRVTTLFMRNADQWEGRYGHIDGLYFVEAEKFVNSMTDDYGRRIVREAFQFIHPDSRGIF